MKELETEQLKMKIEELAEGAWTMGFLCGIIFAAIVFYFWW
jgi:hypothetical protein